MKLLKILNQQQTAIVTDPINQKILKKLIVSELSVSEIAKQINLPVLTVWRRMQKLLKFNLVELSKIEKVSNLEKKLYRSTAVRLIPLSSLEFKPNDSDLCAAYEIYSGIQKRIMAKVSKFREIPKGISPTDFAMFAIMQSFAHVYREPAIQGELAELEHELTKYRQQNISL